MDLTATIEPDSTQINADSLMGGSITVTVEAVTAGNAEQPVNIALVERPGRAYRPSKSMRRVLAFAWGTDGDAYVGRRLTLYRNPDIMFGRDRVGGIEISHLSHIDKPLTIPLTVSRGKKKVHKVDPLPASTQSTPAMPKFANIDEAAVYWRKRQAEGASEQELAEIQSVGSALREAE